MITFVFITLLAIILYVGFPRESFKRLFGRKKTIPEPVPQPKLWWGAGEECCGECNDYAGLNPDAAPLMKAYCLETAYVVKRNNHCHGWNRRLR